MHAPRALACVLVAIAISACSAPPPPRPREGVVTADPHGEGQEFDLSPVPAPAGIIAKGRVRDLGTTMGVLASLVGAPKESVTEAGRALVAQLLARGLRLDIDPSFAGLVSLDAPVDFVAVASDADVSVAFSLGLTSIDGAKAAAGPKVAEVGPGMWAVGGERAKAACVIVASPGPSVARLVCGPRERDVEALAPYLARTVSVEAPPQQDLSAEIDVAAINATFGSTARKFIPGLPMIATKRFGTGNATYDKAFEEGVRFIANDLGLVLEDLTKIRVVGTVDAAKGVDLDVRADLRAGSKSWFSRTALAGASSRVPALLWDAPADASGAVFGTIVDPAAFGDVAKALRGMVAGALEVAKVGSDAERKKVADLVDLPIAKDASFAGLGGFGRVTKAKEAKTEKERQQRHFDRLMGWYLIGTNQKADAWAKWLKDAATAFNQPGVQKALKKELGKNESVAVTTAKPPKELGKGAAQVDVTFASKSGATTLEGTLHVMVMPDGDASWIAMGFDRGELVERLLRARDGKDALSTRKELEALGQGNTTGGLFLTLQSFRSSIYAVMLMRPVADPKAKEIDIAAEALRTTDEVFASLPHKGLSPMFIRTSVQGSTLGLDIEIPKPVLDDTSALVRMFSAKPQ